MSRTLLINVAEPEERRAALLEDGRLSLLWVERADERTLVGNVYKGRVVRVEPAIGAAFVDIGLDRPAFLHADDVVVAGDAARRAPDDDAEDAAPEPGERRIEELCSRGDDVVVQVARDPIGQKGATLTMRLSFPGRTVVLMPGLGRVAVSRRLGEGAARERLLQTLARLPVPAGCGTVARTAAGSASDAEIAAELAALGAQHDAAFARARTRPAPAVLHEETGFASRAVRELLVRAPDGAADPLAVVTDDADAADDARATLEGAERAVDVRVHATSVPLFHAFGIEQEVRRLASPHVPLAGGASLVIHETEALWAIDVNSGRRRRGANLEETALETDLLAAEEAARQIRLRDLAGLIVVDFIDCRDEANRAAVETAFRRALARDPARMRVAPMSEFMVVEITRRRTRTGPGRAGSERCASCHGAGRVRTSAAAALAALRDLRALVADTRPRRVEIVCAPGVADALERREEDLDAIESEHGVAVDVVEDESLGQDGFSVVAARG